MTFSITHAVLQNARPTSAAELSIQGRAGSIIADVFFGRARGDGEALSWDLGRDGKSGSGPFLKTATEGKESMSVFGGHIV